jgi:hypothetical protein
MFADIDSVSVEESLEYFDTALRVSVIPAIRVELPTDEIL